MLVFVLVVLALPSAWMVMVSAAVAAVAPDDCCDGPVKPWGRREDEEEDWDLDAAAGDAGPSSSSRENEVADPDTDGNRRKGEADRRVCRRPPPPLLLVRGVRRTLLLRDDGIYCFYF